MPAKEVMPKFKRGELHSGSKTGPVVKNQKQAVAIMLSEKRQGLAKGGEVMAKKNWIGKARAKMEEKGTVGSLRAATKTPKGKNIPVATEERLAHSDNPKMRKKAQFALNVRK